jgi:hypothetical protein
MPFDALALGLKWDLRSFSIAMTIVRFTGNRIALLASITADIVIYLVLGLLWPFAAACAVMLGLIWVASQRR